MKIIKSIPEYYKEINVPPPKHPFYDIRRHTDNLPTIKAKQEPIRHELYSMSLMPAPQAVVNLNNTPVRSNLFFISPFKVISWDIQAKDFDGWYILFDKEFISTNANWKNFIHDFPFFSLDCSTPFEFSETALKEVVFYFERIFEEYHSSNPDKFNLIQGYTHLLLVIARRHYDRFVLGETPLADKRDFDRMLVSRFQALIESTLAQAENNPMVRYPSLYAQRLNIHPNHLNAVVKKTTRKTASQLIQAHLITQAKQLLSQTGSNTKEVAYHFHFTQASHFVAFFKKHTGLTPKQFKSRKLL